MRDVIAEPYRTKLLPGFSQARQTAADIGALACGIRAPARRCLRYAITRKRRSVWRTGYNNTTCKIRKALYTFAVWTRQAHEHWDNV